jgi:hypothetical protein
VFRLSLCYIALHGAWAVTHTRGLRCNHGNTLFASWPNLTTEVALEIVVIILVLLQGTVCDSFVLVRRHLVITW